MRLFSFVRQSVAHASDRRRWLLLIAVVVAAGGAGFVFLSPEASTTAYRRTGYIATATALVWAVLLAFQLRPRPFAPALRDWAVGLGWGAWVAVGLGWFAALTLQTADYAVVADEPTLVAISYGLHTQRDPAITARGYNLGEGFEAVNQVVDKRPLLFPLLVSLVHDGTGFRVENAFWVNTFLLLALLVLAADAGRHLGSRVGATLFAGLLATSPLVAQMGRSAGFDILGLVMTLLLARVALAFLRQPQDEARAGLLMLVGVLAAQVRYEGALFVGVTALIWLLGAWRHGRAVIPAALFAAPLLLVPHAWRQQVFEQGSDLFQLHFKPGSTAVFDLSYVPDNVGHALNFFLSLDQRDANSPLIFVLGLPALLFGTIAAVRWIRSGFPGDGMAAVWATVGGALAVQTALTFVYFWGQYDDLTAQRLSLPLHLLFAAAVVAVGSRQAFWRRAAGWLAWTLLAYGWLWTVPSLARDRFSQRYREARIFNEVRRVAEAMPAGQVIILDNVSALIWLQAGFSAVMSDTLRYTPERFAWHFERRSFADYLALQRQSRDPSTGAWTPLVEDLIFSDYGLEPIQTWVMGPSYRVQLCRVTRLPDRGDGSRSPGILRPLTAEEREASDRLQKAFSSEWAKQLP